MLFYLNVKHINVNLLKVFLHIFSNLFICNGIHVDNSKVLIIILITNIVMEIPSFFADKFALCSDDDSPSRPSTALQ